MLSIPDALWTALLDAFATATPGHERVAYLDGVRYRGPDGLVHGVAMTVTVPDAITTPGNYTVSAKAMAQAGEHLHVLGMVRLAQVHTHGDDWVGHSCRDDRRAYSQLDGALSLVLPRHATHHPAPTEAGVHLREPTGWRQVTDEEADSLLRLVPSIIDHRSHTWNASPTGTKATSPGDSNRSRRFGRWQWPWSWPRRRRT